MGTLFEIGKNVTKTSYHPKKTGHYNSFQHFGIYWQRYTFVCRSDSRNIYVNILIVYNPFNLFGLTIVS